MHCPVEKQNPAWRVMLGRCFFFDIRHWPGDTCSPGPISAHLPDPLLRLKPGCHPNYGTPPEGLEPCVGEVSHYNQAFWRGGHMDLLPRTPSEVNGTIRSQLGWMCLSVCVCLYTNVDQTPVVGGLTMCLCQDTDMLSKVRKSLSHKNLQLPYLLYLRVNWPF